MVTSPAKSMIGRTQVRWHQRRTAEIDLLTYISVGLIRWFLKLPHGSFKSEPSRGCDRGLVNQLQRRRKAALAARSICSRCATKDLDWGIETMYETSRGEKDRIICSYDFAADQKKPYSLPM